MALRTDTVQQRPHYDPGAALDERGALTRSPNRVRGQDSVRAQQPRIYRSDRVAGIPPSAVGPYHNWRNSRLAVVLASCITMGGLVIWAWDNKVNATCCAGAALLVYDYFWPVTPYVKSLFRVVI